MRRTGASPAPFKLVAQSSGAGPSAFTHVSSVAGLNLGSGETWATWTFDQAFTATPFLGDCLGLLVDGNPPVNIGTVGPDYVELCHAAPGPDSSGLPWSINPTFSVPAFADPLDTLDSGSVS